MTQLPGIGGSLFPGHFLATRSAAFAAEMAGQDGSRRHHFAGWWRRVEATCGPATGLRALFDLVAMPMTGMLGYRARDAEFGRDFVRVRLERPSSGSVQLIVLPWATRPSRRLRDLHSTSGADAGWAMVVAPPFVSVIEMRGHAFRRGIEFRLPDAIDPRSFPAFWRICHAGNLLTPAGLELLDDAARFQDRVRDDLQTGVVEALSALAPVLVNRGPAPPAERPFGEALTLVYRILFLLFAESREAAPSAAGRYGSSYAISSLCRDACEGAGRQTGLWDALGAITRLSRSGCDAAGFTAQPFNGRLFSRSGVPALEKQTAARATIDSRRRDAALARALTALATRPGAGGRQTISYADLGVEQLGAVYEKVLDLDPAEMIDRNVAAAIERGHHATRQHSARRKESGTFYTPQPLAEFVVRRTLAPLVRNASADEVLALRVIDPAMGSGAFLVAACRFLADAYERALVEEGRCAETDLDASARAGIRRLVASRCLAGVDANPVAVQLARLSLWLTTLAKEKPLSFFDHQLRCGNSLVGATPEDLWRLTPLDRRVRLDTPLFEAAGLEHAIRSAARPWAELRSGNDDTVANVRERERLWASLSGERSPIATLRAACDLWCARWFTDGRPGPSNPELRATFDALLRGDRSLAPSSLPERMAAWMAKAREAADAQRFFHWPLEFADLFYQEDGTPKARPGFHAVIGNPPWEMLRGKDAADRSDLTSFIRGSGLYPSCDRGHVNLYQPFLERSLDLTRPGGRVGLVLPWGLATDEGAASLRRRLFVRERVDTLVGLDNGGGMFPIHRGLRFMVLVASPGFATRTIHARLGVRTAAELDELPGIDDPEAVCRFPLKLKAETIGVAGGPSLRIPDARAEGDLDWLTTITARFPRLGEPPWAVRFGRELNATEDSESFGTRGLPVIDGKHIRPFRVDTSAVRRCISEVRAKFLLPAEPYKTARLAYRDVAGVGNRRTLIAAIVPAGVVTTHTLFCLRNRLPVEQHYFLCALFNSAPLNRYVRMLMGGHVTTGLIEQLPVPAWTGDENQLRLAELAEQLSAPDLEGSTRSAMDDEINERVIELYSLRARPG